MEATTIYLETRGATGGDEAKIWADDLNRMYYRYAQKKACLPAGGAWKVTSVSENVLQITGLGVWDQLKNESGVHRVQRIPSTETPG